MRPTDASADVSTSAILHSMALALKWARDVRIMAQHATTPWSKVRGNLHSVWSSEELKTACFMVIHDLIPTNDRLAKIQGSATNSCQHCGQIDTLIHRMSVARGPTFGGGPVPE